MLPPRMLLAENNSPSAEVVIRERLEATSTRGTRGRVYHLKPSGCVKIPAAIFYNRNLYSGKSSSIGVHVNRKVAPQRILSSQTFLGYAKIVFYVDDKTDRLEIRGIKPKFYDICRLWFVLTLCLCIWPVWFATLS